MCCTFKNIKTSLLPFRLDAECPPCVLSDSDKLQDDTDMSVDRYGLSPDSHLADAADFSPKSPLSCADSLCGRSPDYEDLWRPPSPSASPGSYTHNNKDTSLRMHYCLHRRHILSLCGKEYNFIFGFCLILSNFSHFSENTRSV